MRLWRSGNAPPCQGEDPGPIPGSRSQAPLAQFGRGATFRAWKFGVRVAGGARSEAGGHAVRRGGHGRSGLRVPGGSPVPAHRSWKVNRTGAPDAAANRRALARVWGPCPPPSAMENEPARAPATAGNRMGWVTGWDSGSPFSAHGS